MLKDNIKNFARSLRFRLIRFCSTNRFLGRMYFLFDGSFDREFEFVLKGRVEALSSRYVHSHSNSNLRRCIHRLEKGLFHRDRRPKFGDSVLAELTRELPALSSFGPIDAEERRWALETLRSYRDFSRNSDEVDKCISTISAMTPFYEPSDANGEISFAEAGGVIATSVPDRFSQLAVLFRERESVRFFDGRAPDRALLETAVDIAKEAPSACNRQPFHLHLLQNTDDIRYVGGLAPGTSGFLENIPTLGVLVGHASAFRFARDRHLIYVDGGLFLGHLLPAITALGMSSCVLNWTPDYIKDRKVIDYLDLDASKTVVCLLAIGYRDPTASPISTKKSSDNLLRLA